MPRVRGMHGQRLDNAVERVEGVVARVLRGIARTIASLVGASPSTAALSDDDLQPIRQVWEKAVGEDIVPAVAEAFAESARTLAGEFADAGREVTPLTLNAPEAADFLDAATNRLVGVSDTLWEIARRELAAGVRAGDGIEELAARLQEAGGFGIARARMIARTECLPADTRVNGAHVTALFRRPYEGDWIEVVTASGRKLAGTPNHPVLTLAGWKGLGELTEGDHLVCNGSEIERPSPSGDQNVEHPPATLSEIWDAASAICIAERERTRKPDFHGDGLDGYVDVLRPNGMLMVGAFPPLNQDILERDLAPSDARKIARLAKRSTFARDIPINEPIRRFAATDWDAFQAQPPLDPVVATSIPPAQLVQGLPSAIGGQDFLGGQVTPEAITEAGGVKQASRVGFGSSGDAGPCEGAQHGIPVPSEHGPNLLRPKAGLIELDNVFSVFRRQICTHVYNLTTVEGYFVANQIYTSNTIAAANAASLAQAMRVGDATVQKEWMATMDGAACDERTRAAHCAAHEQVQPLGEPFQVGDTWLMYPGQPVGPADAVINCRCSQGYMWGDDEPLTAAAEVHTGAMVALRPSVEDAKRLAVDGGEPADQLHCTQAYLGEAVDIPSEVQQAIIDRLASLVEDAIRPDYDLPLVVDGFAVSMFNPPGAEHPDGRDRSSCVVLGLSGDDLDSIHKMIVSTVEKVYAEHGLEMPSQHAPYNAHLTLEYTDDPHRVEELMDRAGPVTFDAIRVAFGGENTDIPLGPVDASAADADFAAAEPAPDPAAAPGGAPGHIAGVDLAEGGIQVDAWNDGTFSIAAPSGFGLWLDEDEANDLIDAFNQVRSGGPAATIDVAAGGLEVSMGDDGQVLLVPLNAADGLTLTDDDAYDLSYWLAYWLERGGYYDDEGAEAAEDPRLVEPVTASARRPWDPLKHPRGPDGRFIGKGIVGRASGDVGGSHASRRTEAPAVLPPRPAAPGDARRAELSRLRVAELRQQVRESGGRPGRARKTELIDMLAERASSADTTPVDEPAPTAPNFEERTAAALTGDAARTAAPVSIAEGDQRGDLTETQRQALVDYMGPMYSTANGTLRQGRGVIPDDPQHSLLAERVGATDAALARSPLAADVLVERGIVSGRDVFGPAWDGDLTGAEWIEYGYVSTTTSSRLADLFADDRRPDSARLSILVPVGTSGVELSGSSHESELLLQRGLRMRVASDTGPGPGRVIAVEVVPDGAASGGAAGAGGFGAAEAAGVAGPDDDGLSGRGHTAEHFEPGAGEFGAGVDPVAEAIEEPSPGTNPLEALPGEHFHTWVMEGVSTGLRQFAPNAITWREPPFAYHWQWKSSAHNGLPETVQTGLVTRVVRDGSVVHFFGKLDLKSPEGLDYARRVAEGWARWSSVGVDESVKNANIDVEYVLSDGEPPVDEEPEVDLMTFRDYRVAEVTGVSVPALADALVEPTPELIATLTEMGVIDPTPQDGAEPAKETPEDTMGDAPAVHDAPAVVVAAGHTITLPEAPPAAWFDEPADDELPPYGSVRVDANGRLIGLLAPAEVNHRSFPGKRVKVPMGNVDYSGWQNKPHHVAEGHSINVGVITMNCGHASTSPGDWSYTNRREHYDNTCSIAAHARAYEKPGIGVALAGAIAPWLDAEGFGKLLSSDLSGDWPPHPDKPGWRDFIAALAVPVGGFANRARLRVAEGALVAAAVPVQFDDMEIPMEMTEEAPLLVEGTRVRVLDPRDPEVTEGEIAVVHTGPAYALLVPGRDEPVRWYVAEELEPAETALDEPVAEPVEVEEMVASGGPDLRPVMEVMARSVGRDSASRMAALRNRVHRTD